MRLVQWDVDTEWNWDCGRDRERERGWGHQSHIRPALPNRKSISDAGINYQLKLLLRIDSSGCTLALSPIKWEKRKDYMEPSGAF